MDESDYCRMFEYGVLISLASGGYCVKLGEDDVEANM